jgi:hypothetical protein
VHVAKSFPESALELVKGEPSSSLDAQLMLDEIDPVDDEVPVLPVPVSELPTDAAFCGSPAGQVLDPDEKEPSAKK